MGLIKRFDRKFRFWRQEKMFLSKTIRVESVKKDEILIRGGINFKNYQFFVSYSERRSKGKKNSRHIFMENVFSCGTVSTTETQFSVKICSRIYSLHTRTTNRYCY